MQRNGLRTTTLITAALIVGFSACGSDTPTDPNPNGPLTAGQWVGSKVCLYIADDRASVVRNPACDGALDDLGASFIMNEQAGETSSGGVCSFSFRYTDAIAIAGSKFSVPNWTPTPGEATWSFEGTFDDDFLLGSATGTNIPSTGTCTGSFNASPIGN